MAEIRTEATDKRTAMAERMRAGAYLGLHFAGFVASTLLISWGVFVLFFLVIGDFSFDGLMHQLNNIAGRYVAASPARVATFTTTFAIAHLIITIGIVVLRRHLMFPALQSQGDACNG